MDNLAHTLAGAALAETGLKRRTRFGTATLLIGANLPDLDAVAYLFGTGLAFRRGWTHGVLALVVLPLALTGAMLVWNRFVSRKGYPEDRPFRRGQILLLSAIAVLSHPLLDWLNTYGMRWLMPFDGRWFYGDALFIVDPWLWLVLLIGVLMARRRGAGRISLVVAAAYAGVMVGSALVGRSLVEEGIREAGIEPDAVMVGPVPLNPNRRQVIIQQGDRYLLGVLNWLPRPRLRIESRVVPRNATHPMVLRVSGSEEVRAFLAWARFPFFTVERGAGVVAVVLDDLRYSDGTSPSWAAVRIELARSRRGVPATAVSARETTIRPPS